MKVVIVGTGYVGLVTGACFSEMGADVTCVDINQEKIERLKEGIIPIYEPGLSDIVIKNNKEGRLKFETDLSACLPGAELVFSAVGTPPDEDGSADLHYVLDVAHTVGKYMTDYLVLVTKSTVPVGTAKKVKAAIKEELVKRGANIDFDVASNPEFLKEGDAVKDFMSPDRVVVGIESDRAKGLLEKLYKPFLLNGYPILFMDIASAEMTKYAANAMLATRISFMNEVANLCELVDANIDMVRKGMGTDGRIGNRFLYSGCGYGGSCFPKDVKALAHTGKDYGQEMMIVEAVERVNENQKEVLFKKLQKELNGELKGKKVAIWGLSFKPETDDMREAPSVVIIEKLLDAGAEVTAFDPVAMSEAERILGDKINYAKDMYEAVLEADALLMITEWKQFRIPSWKVIHKSMNGNLVIDGRNIYDPKELAENGFKYLRIGFVPHK